MSIVFLILMSEYQWQTHFPSHSGEMDRIVFAFMVTLYFDVFIIAYIVLFLLH